MTTSPPPDRTPHATGDARAGGPAGAAGAAPGVEATPAQAGQPTGPPVPGTRLGSVWLAVAPGLVLLVAVIPFIVENRQDVEVAFFGARWTLPLGVDLLLAAVLGGLVVFLLGSLRILQLRRVARRHHAARSGATPQDSGGGRQA